MLVAMRNTVSGAAIIAAVAAQNFLTTAGDWTTVSTLPAPSDLSVSRAGNAMMYDSTGKLTYAPNNLALWSQDQSNAWWTATFNSQNSATASVITFTGAGYRYSTAITAPQGSVVIAAFTISSGTKTGTVGVRIVDSPGGAALSPVTTVNLTSTPTVYYAVGVVGTAGNFSIGIDNRVGIGGDGIAGTINVTFASVSRVTYETAPRAADQVITTASAYYGPRNDYNPSTLAAKGLLIEGSRTNIALQSRDISNAAWAKSNCTAVTGASAPDGTTSAGTLTSTFTGLGVQCYQALTGAATGANTNSIYIKAGTSAFFWFGIYDGGTAYYTYVNTSTMAIATNSAGTTASIEPVGDGWYRLQLRRTVAAAASYISFGLADADGSTSTTTGRTVLIYGPQAEAGAYASSYIPTAAASVTRAAETLSLANYQNRLIEEFYIDQQTGVSSNALSGPSATSPLTVFTGNGWVTSIRAYTNGAPGTLATPSWLDVSGITGNRMMYDSTGRLTYAPNNLLTYSNDWSNAAWTKGAVGTGVAPTVTYNYAAASNGNPATRLQMSLGATPATAGSRVIQSLAAAPSGSAIVSLWVRSTDGVSSYSIYLWLPSGPVLVNVTGTWTQVFYATTSAFSNMQFGLTGSGGYVALTTSTTADILVSTAAVANVTYETSPRAGDQVITTSAAYYGPRFDYDPNTLAARGLLIEESRVNSCLQSNTFNNASWANTSTLVIITSAAATSPEGTATGWKFQTSAGGSNQYNIQQQVTIASGTVTASAYVKYGNSQWVALGIYDGAWYLGLFDTINGVIGNVSAGITMSSVNCGNGWYRISITRTLGAANPYIGLFLRGSNSLTLAWTPAGTEFNYWYGAQVEVGAFATSYIPTTTASVTRVADVIKLSGAALTAISGSDFSVVEELSLTQSVSNSVLLGGANGSLALIFAASTTQLGSYDVAASPTNIPNATAGSGSWGTVARAALGANASGRSHSMSGGATTTATGAFASSRAVVTIGSYNGQPPNTGWYRGMSIYNQRLSDASLQAKSVVGSDY